MACPYIPADPFRERDLGRAQARPYMPSFSQPSVRRMEARGCGAAFGGRATAAEVNLRVARLGRGLAPPVSFHLEKISRAGPGPPLHAFVFVAVRSTNGGPGLWRRLRRKGYGCRGESPCGAVGAGACPARLIIILRRYLGRAQARPYMPSRAGPGPPLHAFVFAALRRGTPSFDRLRTVGVPLHPRPSLS